MVSFFELTKKNMRLVLFDSQFAFFSEFITDRLFRQKYYWNVYNKIQTFFQ